MKTVDFSETFAASDLKVDRCRQLIDKNKKIRSFKSKENIHKKEIGPYNFFRLFKPHQFMKLYEYSRLSLFIDLEPRSLHVKIKTCFSQKPLGHFQPMFVCNKTENSLTWYWSHDQDGCHGKIPILRKPGMKHQRLKPIILCSNDNRGLFLTYYKARSNVATCAFVWKNVTMTDYLEIIAFCDLEFSLYSKLN